MRLNLIYSSILSLALVSDVSATSESNQLNSPRFLSSSPDSLRALSRAIQHNKLLGRTSKLTNSTGIAKSWNGATLFSLSGPVANVSGVEVSAGVEVTCTTCYVKGNVTAELDFDSDFNIGEAIANFTSDIGEEIKNVTTTAFDYVEAEVKAVFKNLTDDFDFSDVDFSDASLPPLNVSFNVDVPDIPEVRLRLQFDELELYMLIDTVLSAGASYTLNLYSSKTPIGFALDSGTFVGVIASIDLLLAANADIDISSGLHIKVDDGMALDLSLFSQNVSSVTFNGGSFEFLPVTVQSASGVLSAILRVGLHAGVSVDFDKSTKLLHVEAGAAAAIYADLAEFTTNITAVPEGDDNDCQLQVQQVYQLALGAAAGATLVVGPETWGPEPSTAIPIFYTTLADACVKSATKTASATVMSTSLPAVSARANGDMTTTTLSDEVTFTGLVCISTGLTACPASLQSTTKITSTTAVVLTVPSGSKATIPATTQDTIPETIPFDKNVKAVDATTGSPVSYVPPPPPTTSAATTSAGVAGGQSGGSGDKDTGSSGENIPLIIGLSVGLGVPFLIAVVVGIYLIFRRRKYAAISRSEVFQVVSPQPYTDDAPLREKKPTATVTSTGSGGSSR
ncbi:hypothetical protein GGR51DRAFT_560899 [Nemania sp. FL0031]|nr:hypothetical protein GGR51DRAFT_560899 [Nemania sp. FL0031]